MPHSLQPPHDAAQEVNGPTDACLLVHGVPDSTEQLIPQAATAEERLAAAVYRASVAGHRPAGSCRRRQLPALDAMRYGASGPAARIAAVPVAEEAYSAARGPVCR